MSQFQLLITVASLAELQQLSNHLQSFTSVGHSAVPAVGSATSPAALTGVATPLPNINPVSPDDDFDAEEEEIDPASIFGTSPAPGTFNTPNVAATAAPLIPVQPVATAALQTPAGVELDPRGYPWDARINPESRLRIAKGNTWKLIRGIDKGVVAAVEAELRSQGYGNPQGAPAVQAPQVIAPLAAAPGLPGLPGAIAAPIMPAAPAGPSAESITGRFTKGLQLKVIDKDWILSTLNHYGVTNLQTLRDSPAAWADINAFLDTVRDSGPQFKDL